MSSNEAPAPTLSIEQRAQLHRVARASVEAAASGMEPPPVNVVDYPAELGLSRGCFVTLQRHDSLRGCLGSLQARGPLVSEVSRLAHAAALRDPRFTPLSVDELEGLSIKISVLSPAERMSVGGEAELLASLRPGIDGLILSDGSHSATFLPDVWATFDSAHAFLERLRAKAGLSPGHWSPTTVVERYTTESF